MRRPLRDLARVAVLGGIAATTSCGWILGLDEFVDQPPRVCEPGATVPCYAGPAGTDGVGICVAGARTCNADGTGYDECEGEVRPAVEDCSQPEDEDCSGLACGQPLWSRLYGDVSDQGVTAVAVDASGAIYVAGAFSGVIDLGGGPLVAAGSTDVFVAKMDPQGKHIWSRRFGDANSQVIHGFAVDSAGNVVMGGNSRGQIAIDGVSLSSLNGAFVLKFNSSGRAVWGRLFDDVNPQNSTQQTARAVALDSAGNVVVTGLFQGQVDFGAGPVDAQFNDAFLVKLSGVDGASIWVKQFIGAGGEEGHSVAIDLADNIVLQGLYYVEPFSLGGPPLPAPAANASAAFLARFDAQGNHAWSKSLGAEVQVGFAGLTVAGDGSVLLAGAATSGVDLGGGPLPVQGDYSAVVARFSAAGLHLMSKTYGGSAGAYASAIAADPDGNILLAGSFDDVIDFGGGGVLVGSGSNLFLAKLGTSGTHTWSQAFRISGQNGGVGDLVADGSGSVVLVGGISGDIDFGTGLMASAGGNDAFVATFAP